MVKKKTIIITCLLLFCFKAHLHKVKKKEEQTKMLQLK
jgi:hypothetical protein